MDKQKFKAMLIFLIPQLVKEIVDRENISETDAIRTLYESELYAALEKEATKLWHLSPKALYEMYAEEKLTGKITYPEEA